MFEEIRLTTYLPLIVSKSDGFHGVQQIVSKIFLTH